jgi:hypothetical protein
MANWIKELAIRWKLRALGPRTPETPPGWDRIKKVALVLESSPRVNKSEIDAFLERLGKYVEVFYVEARSYKPSFSDWRCFTRQHFNLLSLPKQKVLDDLRKKEFDLVINASSGDEPTSVLLAAAIPAGLHCTSAEKFHGAQLVITANNTSGIIDYLTQVMHYLQMIRPGKL